MTVVETVLVFVVAPLAFSAVVTALVMFPALRNRDRYRPGKPWGHGPVWYEPRRPGAAAHDEHDAGHDTITPGARASALAIGQAPHAAAAVPTVARTAAGGARGTW